MTVAERLKFLREQKNLTMDNVAKALNVAQQTYFKYEHGIIVNIPIEKVEVLARIFGVTESYIMGWEKLHDNDIRDNFTLAGELFAQLDPNDQAEMIDIMKVKLNRKKDIIHAAEKFA